MKKSPKDRIFLLRVEQELINFMKDANREESRLSAPSSYNRMLVHRMATYFGLEHNVDASHSSVIITKKDKSKMPETRLKECIKDDESLEEPKKLILKRDSSSMEDSSSGSFEKDKSPDLQVNGSLSDSSRSRSLEEREEHYERVRARIFSDNSLAQSNGEHSSPRLAIYAFCSFSPIVVLVSTIGWTIFLRLLQQLCLVLMIVRMQHNLVIQLKTMMIKTFTTLMSRRSLAMLRWMKQARNHPLPNLSYPAVRIIVSLIDGTITLGMLTIIIMPGENSMVETLSTKPIRCLVSIHFLLMLLCVSFVYAFFHVLSPTLSLL